MVRNDIHKAYIKKNWNDIFNLKENHTLMDNLNGINLMIKTWKNQHGLN